MPFKSPLIAQGDRKNIAQGFLKMIPVRQPLTIGKSKI
jgi:hypothetical protein